MAHFPTISEWLVAAGVIAIAFGLPVTIVTLFATRVKAFWKAFTKGN